MDLKFINIDGTETMETMIQKINENFTALLNFSEASYVYRHKQKLIASEGQTHCAFGTTFVRNSNSLMVFLNGVLQIQNESYVETSSTTIRFLEPLSEGDEVYMVGLEARPIVPEYIDPLPTDYLHLIPNKAQVESGKIVFYRSTGSADVALFSVPVTELGLIPTKAKLSDGILTFYHNSSAGDKSLFTVDMSSLQINPTLAVDNQGVVYVATE